LKISKGCDVLIFHCLKLSGIDGGFMDLENSTVRNTRFYEIVTPQFIEVVDLFIGGIINIRFYSSINGDYMKVLLFCII